MENSWTIQNPFGVSVFGSALLRVSPDSALITGTVTRLEQKPADSFAKAQESARVVAEFLRKSRLDDFGMSRMSLSQESRVTGGEYRFLGYKASIGFTIAIKTLDRLEEVVSGVIEAGINEITSIEFHTSQLKDLRMQARRLAIAAAKEKAATYAEAGSVSLGDIIHIQDLNTQALQRQWRSQFHIAGQGQTPREIIDHDAGRHTLDPGAIEVTAAVLVAFSLNQKA